MWIFLWNKNVTFFFFFFPLSLSLCFRGSYLVISPRPPHGIRKWCLWWLFSSIDVEEPAAGFQRSFRGHYEASLSWTVRLVLLTATKSSRVLWASHQSGCFAYPVSFTLHISSERGSLLFYKGGDRGTCPGARLGLKAMLIPRPPPPACDSSVLGCALGSLCRSPPGGSFASQGVIWRYQETLWCHDMGAADSKVAIGLQWVESRYAGKDSTCTGRLPTVMNYPASNASSSGGERPCYKGEHRRKHSLLQGQPGGAGRKWAWEFALFLVLSFGANYINFLRLSFLIWKSGNDIWLAFPAWVQESDFLGLNSSSFCGFEQITLTLLKSLNFLIC